MNDLKFAVRQLLKNPGFTAVAVLTLALGIGANTVIFSVINAVLLRQLPFRDSDRLVLVETTGFFGDAMSGGDFRDIQEQVDTLSHTAAYSKVNMNLSGDAEPERINAARVSSTFLPTLDEQPALGRSFAVSEDRSGSDKVVLLSHGLWLRRFGGDRSIVGHAVRLDAQSYTVIGVMPAGFEFPEKTDVWAPLGLGASERNDYNNYFLQIIGRRKPTATSDQVQLELATIAQRSTARYPEFRKGWELQAVPLHEYFVGGNRAMLYLLGAVGLVLFIACANVASLLLTRATGRQREMAIRSALGAGRLRLTRQLLVESTLLVCLGAVSGLMLSNWSLTVVNASLPSSIPRIGQIGLDAHVLVFTAVISTAAGLVFGLVPALQAARPGLSEALSHGTRTANAGAGARRFRAALVVSEVAMAVVLLVGSGLMIKSLIILQNVPLGFRSDRVLTARIELSDTRYATDQKRLNFQRELLEKLLTLPGVESAGIASRLPLSGGNMGYGIAIEGHASSARASGEMGPAAGFRSVTPGYFRAMQIPLLGGRGLTDSDNETSRHVAVINEAMAKKFWPGENPIGRRIGLTVKDAPWIEIVGIIGDVRHQALDRAPDPEMFVPFSQSPVSQLNLVLRTTSEPKALIASLRTELGSLDKDQPIFGVRTMDEWVSESVAQPRFRAWSMGTFGFVAMVLAAIGLYGVISYSVAQRTQEIGVRMALGAERRDVLALIVSQGLRLTLAGLAIGLAGAFAATRVLRTLLFGITPTDTLTFVNVALLLAVVAALACWLPARRAARVDPMVALRNE